MENLSFSQSPIVDLPEEAECDKSHVSFSTLVMVISGLSSHVHTYCQLLR